MINCNPRLKFLLVLAAVISFTFTSTLKGSLWPISVTVVLLFFARLNLLHVLKTILVPFTLLIIMMPLIAISTPGGLKEGLLLSYTICIRSICMFISFLTFFQTTSFNKIIKTLHDLKFPPILIHILTFTYRYIFLYLDNLAKLLTAAKLRGYTAASYQNHVRTVTNIICALLIRSFEQSERVYQAMILRGFENEL